MMEKEEPGNHSFQQLKEVCDPHLFPGLTRFFQAIEALYRKDRTINIAVFGQFKAGKSSFLNHITGTSLLPTGILPVTNVVTLLEYGSLEMIRVFFLDGKERTIDRKELPAFISEQHNSDNHRQVAKVVITLPQLEEYRGLRFIDTPGVGSIFSHNTQAALDFTPDTGLAIVAINPGSPLSEEDLKLIRELRTYTPRIYLLLTKTDLYEESDLQQIEQFIRKTMEDHFHLIYPVYRYSVMRDDARFRQVVLQNIIRPMAERRKQLSDEILDYKTRSLARSCLTYLEASLRAARVQEKEKERLMILLEEQRQDMDRRRRELKVITQSYTAATHDRLTEILLPHYEEIAVKLQKEFAEEYPSWRGSLSTISRRFEQWLAKHLIREIDLLAEETRRQWERLLKEPHKHFVRYLEEARRQRNEQIQEALHTTLQDQPVELVLPEVTRPDVSVYWAFDTNIDLLWWLIPMPLFRRSFGRFFSKRIAAEAEKNLYREVSLLTKDINKSLESMQEETLRQLRNDLITAEKILLAEEDESRNLEEKIHALRAIAGSDHT